MAIDIGSMGKQVNDATQGQLDPTRGIDLGKVTNPETVFSKSLSYLIWAAGIIAVVVIIYAGFQYMTAGGDAEKAGKAKQIIVGTIIGILIIMFSYIAYNTTVKVLQRGSSSTVNTILNEKASDNVQ
jgi:hypothetical protein